MKRIAIWKFVKLLTPKIINILGIFISPLFSSKNKKAKLPENNTRRSSRNAAIMFLKPRMKREFFKSLFTKLEAIKIVLKNNDFLRKFCN